GGLTTFATMAYIIVVNPAILANNEGIDRDAGTIATILAAVFGTLLMGVYANRPIAVAPYMGENAFIAFSLAAIGLTWQQRLGTVFVSGALFLVLTLTGLRAWLANAVPASLKYSFAAGIGLFLLFIGVTQAGLVTVNIPEAPLKITPWGAPQVLTVAGVLVIAWLMHLRMPGAILIGIIAIALVGVVTGHAEPPAGIVDAPWSYDLGKIAGQLDIAGVLTIELAPVLFTLFLMSFLDTLGTLYALGAAGNMLDEHGHFPKVEKPMLVDALACMFSALVGTSTSGAYIESATGIRDGARTGLAAVVTALCFALALFFLPLIEPMQELKFAYAPALIIVGILMFAAARNLDMDDLTESVPALACIALMVFTMNIANGLAAGLILHPLLKLLTWQWRRIHPGTALLGAASACYYLFGMPH
ncbi:MAG: NCS2 family permease, partial [Gemmataceae bacterium]|nr:NCS2 family permease [Gemmataceae bacterium]